MLEVTATVLSQDPSARVLILSASGEQADVLDAVKAGATGYLVKSASREELIRAVHRVAHGDTVFTPGLAGWCSGSTAGSPRGRPPPMSTRRSSPSVEQRCSRWLVEVGAQRDRRAARAVHRTVQSRVQRLRKLQCTTGSS